MSSCLYAKYINIPVSPEGERLPSEVIVAALFTTSSARDAQLRDGGRDRVERGN